MKHSRIAILLIALATAMALLLGSCAGRHTARALDRIALIADSHPDSALALLDSLTPHLGNSDALRARHTALTAHARYKAYLPLPPRDSLEAAAGAIGASSVPPRERMMLNLYLGIARQADSLYAPAIVALFDAADNAQTIDDNLSLGIIYRTIAEIYSEVHIGREAVHYSRLSLDAFNLVEDPKYRYFGLLDLAIMLNNVKEYDECLTLCDSIFNCVDINRYPDIIYEADYIKIFALVGTYNDNAAIETYGRLVQCDTDFENLHKIMALAYSRCGRTESIADFATSDILSDSTLKCTLYPYFAAIGDFKTAYHGIASDLEAQNAEYDSIIKQNLTSSIHEYLDHKRDDEHRQAMIYRFLWICGLITFFVIITTICILFHQSHKNKIAVINQHMATAQGLRQLLSISDSKLCETKEFCRSLFIQKFQTIDELCQTYFAHNGSGKEKSKIYEQVSKIIKDLADNKSSSLREMENSIDRDLDNLMTRFRNDYPNMPSTDRQLYMYYVMGFSVSAICVFFNIKPSVVYNRKNALKNRIIAGKNPNMEWYLSFL